MLHWAKQTGKAGRNNEKFSCFDVQFLGVNGKFLSIQIYLLSANQKGAAPKTCKESGLSLDGIFTHTMFLPVLNPAVGK
jgi:hypothetical protein